MTIRIGLVTAMAHRDWHAMRLAEALSVALGRDGRVEVVDPSRLQLFCGEADRPVRVLANGTDASRFDVAVLGRVVGPDADPEVQLNAARALELTGVRCVNRVGPMLVAQDKLWTAAVLAKAGLPTPACASVPTRADVRGTLARFGPAVAKPLFGSLGDGVFQCDRPSAATRLGKAVRKEAYLVQRLVRPVGVDLRLFVVGGRVHGCIRRVARGGEWRANAVLGARVTPVIPRPEWVALAVAATRALRLEVAGIDLVLDGGQPSILEVNGFPSFRAIWDATGRDMARPIAALAVRLARTRRRRRERTASPPRRTAAAPSPRRIRVVPARGLGSA